MGPEGKLCCFGAFVKSPYSSLLPGANGKQTGTPLMASESDGATFYSPPRRERMSLA